MDNTQQTFEQDVDTYTRHLAQSLLRFKIVGVVRKDRTERDSDPELGGIFVPLRITLAERSAYVGAPPSSLLEALEQHRALVLLGGPGSGKSIALRYLAWSSAAARLGAATPHLSDTPVPLRIELRRFMEEHRRNANTDFLTYVTSELAKEKVSLESTMFERLLKEQSMLLLFDGLDEIATIREREQLAVEIQTFVARYPGNRVIVSSRPVGYDLAPMPTASYVHVNVCEFDDDQIEQFLHRWYEHVLRLSSPLPSDDEQELQTLITTIQTNQRLHKLAENPLLLTVMTALHRYERLPDRRVALYDRCAELLLDTWSKIRKTDVRWQDMRMSKEDQIGCIAHLGLVLHQLAQQEEGAEELTSSDAPESFIVAEIARFLDEQKMISDQQERQREARRLLQLAQEEAGLLVERGTSAQGEPLYGFIHRTFQEYFAAVAIYENYLQEEDASIIRDFFIEHLHDPHWKEVIFLLLGKMRRKPVTTQLDNILKGKIISKRSRYKDILQQDLFFVCHCLIEEIPVENELVEQVLARLTDLVYHAPLLAQKQEAMGIFGSLLQTRQYANAARNTLIDLMRKNDLPEAETIIQAAQALYKHNGNRPEAQQLAMEVLFELLEHSDLHIGNKAFILTELWVNSTLESEAYQSSLVFLTSLLHISPERAGKLIEALCVMLRGNWDDDHKNLVTYALPLLTLVQQFSVSLTLTIVANVVDTLPRILRTHKQQRNNKDVHSTIAITQDHLIEIARIFIAITQNSEVAVEQRIDAVLRTVNLVSWIQSMEKSSISTNAFVAATVQKLAHIVKNLYHFPPDLLIDLQEQNPYQHIRAFYLQMLQYVDLSYEQLSALISFLYNEDCYTDVQMYKTTQLIVSLVQTADYPIKKVAYIAQHCGLHREDSIAIALSCIERSRQQNLSIAEQYAIVSPFVRRYPRAVQMLMEMLQAKNIADWERLAIVQALYRNTAPSSAAYQQAVEVLLAQLKLPDTPVEQIIQVAQILLAIKVKYIVNEERIEHRAYLVHATYPVKARYDLTQNVVLIFQKTLERENNSFQQALLLAFLLFYTKNALNLEKQQEVRLDSKFLWQLTQEQRFTPEERALFATIPLAIGCAPPVERIQAVQRVLELVGAEQAPAFFEKHWRRMDTSTNLKLEDIPRVAELAREKLLPAQARDQMYQLLKEAMPRFDQLDESAEPDSRLGPPQTRVRLTST